jgi:hypothetical protein
MNITNIVTKLQNLANTTLTSFQIMTLSKAVEKLNVGTIESVASLNLLSATSSNAGNLFYVVSEEEIYYSTGQLIYPLSGVGITAIYAWGKNAVGQLGDNTNTSRLSPVTTLTNSVLWSNISAGYSHSLAIAAGVAYGWGFNGDGSLGDNTTSSRKTPVTVVGGINTWTQVSAGTGGDTSGHSLGLTSAGIAYAWGENSAGQLGDNTTTSRLSPVTVVGAIDTWAQVSAGESCSLGRTSGGVLYAWGSNQYGRLGDGTTTARSSPVTVVGGFSNWSQVGKAGRHSLAFRSDGVLYAWGRNAYGQLGDNTTTSRSSPVTVVGGINTWTQVSGSKLISLGVTSTGVAYAWGQNNYGQLGDNTGTGKSSPVTVVGGINNWNQVSSGHQHNLGRTSAGVAYAWGRSLYGENGDSTTTTRSSPVIFSGGLTNWTQVAAGGRHSLALRTFT